ncbi:MAG: hypothetical protein B7Y25_08590 [Alphaproteobacteria bacterium 16-39-46]|nr:MAG: hypothetical protein B7Y25_08590 [Alphaproteobacteria bacterium 16-39-46]OZA42377.1 MAG: hypothetical protein B7X84_06190 [Alphaproteobacteria bacterium 17-39-52]HQS83976.1 Imm39 family immunity protein [Alphaproteobacteria bacterium]HQS93848.1 Imm39 family immunity protein [Alphaproteobacteria bacterium]
MFDPFDRRIGFSAVSLVMGRVKNDLKILTSLQEKLTGFLKKHGYFQNVPFLFVGLIFLYGIKNDLKLKFQRINKKYGGLGTELELDMKILQWADQNNLELLHDIFMIGALETLLQVCKKYSLPDELIIKERLKYGSIPNTIEECEAYKSS